MEVDHLLIIDWDLGIRLAGNKREFAEEIMNLLIKNLLDDVPAITKLHQEKNYPVLLQRIHRLHGAICYTGLPRLKLILAHLEAYLKKKELTNVPMLLEKFNKEVTLLLEHYPAYYAEVVA